MVKNAIHYFRKDLRSFFLNTTSPKPLAVFRIIFGIALLYYFWTLMPLLTLYFGEGGILHSPHIANLFSERGGFTSLQPNVLIGFYVVTLLLSTLFAVGLFTRFCATALWTLNVAWTAPLHFGLNGGDQVVGILLFLFLVASLTGHTQRTLSIDSILSKKIRPWFGLPKQSEYIPLWSTRMFQIQLVLIYVFTAFAKIKEPLWQDGTALYYIFNQTIWTRVDVSWLSTIPLILPFATYGTLLFEGLLFPILVWPKKTRAVILLTGTLFHASIGLTMRVFIFSWIMPIFYLCFLTENHLNKLGTIFGKIFNPHHHNKNENPRIYFDGVCNLCNQTIRFIINNDPTHIFRFAPLQSVNAPKPKLDTHSTPVETILLMENGVTYEKSSAVLRILSHLAFPWPLISIFLLVPKFIRDSIYSFIAKNRYQWFGKQNTCMVPTPETERLFLS